MVAQMPTKNFEYHPFIRTNYPFSSFGSASLENESVDLVIAGNSWVARQNEESKILFSEIYRVLKPEGLVIFDSCDKN